MTVPDLPARPEQATEEGEVVHISAQPIKIGNRVRQRCAWCGAIIDDTDLAGLAVALTPGETEPQPYPMWPVNVLIARNGNATYVVADDGTTTPPNCCVRLDPEVTV